MSEAKVECGKDKHRWQKILSVTPTWRCYECGEITATDPHPLRMITRSDVEPMNREKRF